MTMKSTENEVRLYDELKALQPGNKIVVDGLDKYFAQFQFVGSRPICFYAETANEAKSQTGDWDNVNILKVAVTPVYETKIPKAPKRVDYPQTEEGGEEFDADYTVWFVKYGKKKETAPAATVTVPVESQTPAEPVNNITNEVETNKTEKPMQVAQIHSTTGFNKAADYVAQYRNEAPDLNWDSVKDWKSLCYVIGITDAQIGADSARRVIDRIAAKNGQQVEKKAETKELETVDVVKAVNGSVKKSEKTPNETKKVNNIINEANDDDELARELAEILRKRKGGNSIDIEQLTALIETGIESRIEPLRALINENVRTVQVQVNNGVAVKVDGLVHESFDSIIKLISIRENIMLVGPAGSGKTTVCEQAAEALEMNFFAQSVCAQTSKSELLGYMDANGKYVRTIFREAYENGGVFVLDEIDAGNPNVIAVLNSALANSLCSFADGMVRKHPDFVLIGAANTFGTGANIQYVGRNQLDAATLDRFSVLEFKYDTKLETALTPNKVWFDFVQQVRRELANERVVISPRASIAGSKLIAAGFTPKQAAEMRVIKGMPNELKVRVLNIFDRLTW